MEPTDNDGTDNVVQLATAGANGPSVAVLTGDDRVQYDYFGFENTHRVFLADGVSYIEHKELNEGQRRKFLNATNRDVVLNQRTNEAKLKSAPGDDRKALFEAAICGWNLVRGGQPLPFNARNLSEVLEKFPPQVLDAVERDIRKHNTWLFADMTIEDIEKGIADLTELLEQKKQEQEGNAGSSS